MISYIEYGNIFDLPDVKNYAHGCNCAGAMGKGIALQFKVKYPQMYEQYKVLCHEGKYVLGDVFSYFYGDGYIYNLGTQYTWRTKANIDAIEKSVEKMLMLAIQDHVEKIAMPKIGAGLGGLNWLTVKESIERISDKYPQVELVIVENYVS